MKAKLLVSALVFSVAALVARPAFGDYNCPTAYGGEVCPTGDVTIDKKVQNPQTSVFVDNLGTSDVHFRAGQEVTFRLAVKNVSDTLIDKVDVFDFLPVELEYISGPGTYDLATREVRFSVEQLGPNATRDFEVKAKVVSEDKLPARSLLTVVNKAEVRLAGKTDQDTAQVVIERAFAGGLPATGPESVALILSGSSLSAITGLALMRRAKNLS